MTKLLINIGVCCILLLPIVVVAQEGGGYVRLVGLPFEQANNQDINEFIKALYRLAIGVAATLAVLRLILAGAQYMFTDVVTTKADAKKNVQNSLVGLLVVLAAVLILNTINPQLTNLEALDIKKINVDVNFSPVEQCDVQSSATCCIESGGNWVLNSNVGSCNTGSESRGELEDGLAGNMLDEAIEDGEFTEVVEVYDLNEIPLAERQEYISNIWPDQCELDVDGEENGNLFREIENTEAGVIRYICVQP